MIYTKHVIETDEYFLTYDDGVNEYSIKIADEKLLTIIRGLMQIEALVRSSLDVVKKVLPKKE